MQFDYVKWQRDERRERKNNMRFGTYHPAITFLYFFAVILFSCCFQHPVMLGISVVFSFMYSSYLNVRTKEYSNVGYELLIILVRLTAVIAFVLLFACYYSYGHHFGMTYLRQNFAGNYITLESFAYGLSIGIRIISVILWLSCVHRIMTTDKIVYLFGRISPRISLYFAIIMRLIPNIHEKGKKVNVAQTCIGKGTTQGNMIVRLFHTFRMISILVTWTFEHIKESGDSMKSRGYTLKNRTAFSIYRFDNRDRTLVIWIFLLLTLVCVGTAFNQSTIVYNPVIFIQPITALSFVFYGAYLAIMILPFWLDIKW